MRKPDRRKGPGPTAFPLGVWFDAERFSCRHERYLKRVGRALNKACTRYVGWNCPFNRQSFKRTKHGRRVFPGGRVRYGAAAALLCCLLVLCSSAFGAIAQPMQWDVRTTGSDSNGGGFDGTVASPGTDFSQQNSAQIAYTDLVIGATTTQYTSVLNPVGATLPGNVIQITGGTGCTTGLYEVLSNATITATVDRSMGTAASVCTANLGGSFATVQKGLTAATANGNTVNVKNGTYTQTVSLLPNNIFFQLVGYNSTHGDGGTAPLITTSTNSIDGLLQLQTAGETGVPVVRINNITFSNTAATPGSGIVQVNRNAGNIVLQNITMSGFTAGVNLDNAGAHFELLQTSVLTVQNSTIKNCTSYGINVNQGQVFLQWSLISGNTTVGLFDNNSGSSPSFFVQGSVFSGNGIGIREQNASQGMVTINSSVFYNQTAAGVQIDAAPTAFLSANSIYYQNGTFGVNIVSANAGKFAAGRANAYGANGTAGSLHFGSDAAPVTLSANPFVSAGTGNFALNSTAGGGAALKAVGFPGVGLAGTGFLDIGALQSQAAAASVTAVGFVQ